MMYENKRYLMYDTFNNWAIHLIFFLRHARKYILMLSLIILNRQDEDVVETFRY